MNTQEMVEATRAAQKKNESRVKVVGINQKTGNAVLISDISGCGTHWYSTPRYIRVVEITPGTAFAQKNSKNVHFFKQIGEYQYPRTRRQRIEYEALLREAMRIAKARCGYSDSDAA